MIRHILDVIYHVFQGRSNKDGTFLERYGRALASLIVIATVILIKLF